MLFFYGFIFKSLNPLFGFSIRAGPLAGSDKQWLCQGKARERVTRGLSSYDIDRIEVNPGTAVCNSTDSLSVLAPNEGRLSV